MYLANSEFSPAGNQPLTPWGQRDGLCSGLLLTWDKSPPARTAGVRWGWREGQRKAVQGSPVTGERKDKYHIRVVNTPALSYFPSSQWKSVALLHFPRVCCVSKSRCSRCDYQCMSVVCRTVVEYIEYNIGLQIMCVDSLDEAVCSGDWPPGEIHAGAGWQELQ